MAFTLEQLRGFVAVAEELHFSRAASRLAMTQPPLSRQIQKLERAVGAQLLIRDNRRVTLTAAGEVFLVEARRLLSLADTAPELARRVSSGSSGVVRVGFTAAATYGILGRLLDELAAQLPDVDVELVELVTREQVSGLVNEEIDLGLGRPPFDDSTFGSRLLHRERLLLAVPGGHPLAALGRAATAADVVREPVVMHSPTDARYFYDLVVRTVPIAPENTVHTVSQVLTMLWLVAAGRGVAFVPESAARLRIDGVEFARLETAVAEPVELHLLWLKASANPALWRTLSVLEGRTPFE
ncbi:LysR family transcriptional regulator [Saccharothrix sp. 6-C]|uniref:DNA-binding transcriptional LysR family regulator n=1 Tax=Saccharothrix texasensis TaxID=103734 RepID=A0A3N1HK04_9PSEU|nr:MULTISPECIES: LysR substrate-binding domain-containing protein [Saccharothrix]QQQ73559.1 LysR family transcriptional regulator [Saccharothrix sp. 6-C]ROP42602.1 DNA-binding transcriptional LysR family regulator [Saccharothrix texasensis]